MDDPNAAWQQWKTNLISILDQHAPSIHIREKQSNLPWINQNIKKLMRDRGYHKKRAIKYNSEHHWKLYSREARNKVNIQLRKLKVSYYKIKIETCENQKDPKQAWKLINSLRGKNSKTNCDTEIQIDDLKIYIDPVIAELKNSMTFL